MEKNKFKLDHTAKEDVENIKRAERVVTVAYRTAAP